MSESEVETTGSIKPIELDVNMTFEDMYRFNLYHVYHGSQGILSIVLALMLVAISLMTWGDVNVVYNVLYLLAAVVLVLYVPLSLRSRVKKQMKTNEAYQHPVHYTFDETGVTTSVGEQQASIPWKQLYKIVSTKRMVLIYGGRIRANVVPRDQMGDTYDAVYELAKAQMESYRFKMKK
jgi:hypothetical protein